MQIECGFNSQNDLVHFGPTLNVMIGFDPSYRSDSGNNPNIPANTYLALVDTGATQSCIDSALGPVATHRHRGQVGPPNARPERAASPRQARPLTRDRSLLTDRRAPASRMGRARSSRPSGARATLFMTVPCDILTPIRSIGVGRRRGRPGQRSGCETRQARHRGPRGPPSDRRSGGPMSQDHQSFLTRDAGPVGCLTTAALAVLVAKLRGNNTQCQRGSDGQGASTRKEPE